MPYGELLVDEHSLSEELPYKFNGKQFDEETGMYYYGARYYEPRLSLWMSTDPLQEKYINISSYCYTFDNPIRFFDRNGEEGDVPQILYHNAKNAANVLKHASMRQNMVNSRTTTGSQPCPMRRGQDVLEKALLLV